MMLECLPVGCASRTVEFQALGFSAANTCRTGTQVSPASGLAKAGY